MIELAELDDRIFKLIHSLVPNLIGGITRDTALIGDGGILDSMKLVELCLLLEDEAKVLKFEFDWTSDVAMSRSRSMFVTAGSLAKEFHNQMLAR